MRHLSQLQAPALAGVINQKSAAGAISAIKHATVAGADMIDLHLGETGNTGSPKYIADTVLFLAENDLGHNDVIIVVFAAETIAGIAAELETLSAEDHPGDRSVSGNELCRQRFKIFRNAFGGGKKRRHILRRSENDQITGELTYRAGIDDIIDSFSN